MIDYWYYYCCYKIIIVLIKWISLNKGYLNKGYCILFKNNNNK